MLNIKILCKQTILTISMNLPTYIPKLANCNSIDGKFQITNFPSNPVDER